MANTWSRNPPYMPGQKMPYKISRSKIELFTQCPRCFWLDGRLKLSRPSTPPFNINKAIDELFKKEFDVYRRKGEPHPIMIDNQIKAVPFSHDDLNKWRANFTGVATLHKPTNLYVFGAVDDVWISENDELIVVDYKATAKSSEVNIDSDWQISYKRQMEIYQWLLRQNDFNVSNIGYFVYANGRVDLDGFNDRIEFRTKLIAYEGQDHWVEESLSKIKKCLESENMPAVGFAAMGGVCDYCEYAKSRTQLTLNELDKKPKKTRT